jgi:hypothetical protein
MDLLAEGVVLAFSVLRYFFVGGVAVLVGGFIQRHWKEPKAAKWSLLIGVLVFGFAVYHCQEIMRVLASNAGGDN